MAETKKRYNYIKKKIAPGTWTSLILGGIGVLLFLLCLLISVVFQGQGPLVIGALGLSSLLCSVSSVAVVLRNLQEKNRNQLGIRIAGVGSGILTLLWVVLIFVGLRLS